MDNMKKKLALAVLTEGTITAINAEPKKLGTDRYQLFEKEVDGGKLSCEVDLAKCSIAKKLGDVEFYRFDAETDDKFVDMLKKLSFARLMTLTESDRQKAQNADPNFVAKKASEYLKTLYSKATDDELTIDDISKVDLFETDIEYPDLGIEAHVSVIVSIPDCTIKSYVDGVQYIDTKDASSEAFLNRLSHYAAAPAWAYTELTEVPKEFVLDARGAIEMSMMIVSPHTMCGALAEFGLCYDAVSGYYIDKQNLKRVGKAAVFEKLLDLPVLKNATAGHIFDIQWMRDRVNIIYKKD